MRTASRQIGEIGAEIRRGQEESAAERAEWAELAAVAATLRRLAGGTPAKQPEAVKLTQVRRAAEALNRRGDREAAALLHLAWTSAGRKADLLRVVPKDIRRTRPPAVLQLRVQLQDKGAPDAWARPVKVRGEAAAQVWRWRAECGRAPETPLFSGAAWGRMSAEVGAGGRGLRRGAARAVERRVEKEVEDGVRAKVAAKLRHKRKHGKEGGGASTPRYLTR